MCPTSIWVLTEAGRCLIPWKWCCPRQLWAGFTCSLSLQSHPDSLFPWSSIYNLLRVGIFQVALLISITIIVKFNWHWGLWTFRLNSIPHLLVGLRKHSLARLGWQFELVFHVGLDNQSWNYRDVDTSRTQLLPPEVGPELDMKDWTRYQVVE